MRALSPVDELVRRLFGNVVSFVRLRIRTAVRCRIDAVLANADGQDGEDCMSGDMCTCAHVDMDMLSAAANGRKHLV